MSSSSNLTIEDSFVVLEHDATRLVLDPQRGGSIREFVWRDRNVLRPTPPSAGDDPLDTACFPMLPYVNRVADGRFNFAGRSVRLERNWSADPHPLHGQGWRARWSVVTATQSTAVLRFEGGGNDWPWRYRGEQSFALGAGELFVDLTVENLADTPMPAMLGLHPYFADAAQATLRARSPRVWLTDAAFLPVTQTQTPSAWSFEPARAVHAVPLDHCFCGWDGIACLRWPDRTVTVRAAHCGYLHVYAPAAKDFFCIEPQTAAPGALGREAGEAAVIAPGERLGIRVHFAVGAA